MRPDGPIDRWRRGDHRFRRGRWPPPHFLALHSLHRRMMVVIVLAIGVGALGEWALHAAAGSVWSWVCAIGAGWFLAWPLGWVALWIARPMRDLARIARALNEGNLDRRRELSDGAGEVGELAGALRGLGDRVARQLRDQRSLMAAVSHELRSPLGRVRILTELIREGRAPVGAFDDLQREVDGMDALVGDLLAASRIDFEAVAFRPLDVRDVALRALDLAGLPAHALVVSGEAGSVTADPTLLARALRGLLDNARRYGGEHVALKVEDLGERVQLTVEDDGPGFAEGDEVLAFEPFWRGPANGAAAPAGEGLGLALVRQIAEAHGGEAGARNLEGGGARVWLALPRDRAASAPG